MKFTLHRFQSKPTGQKTKRSKRARILCGSFGKLLAALALSAAFPKPADAQEKNRPVGNMDIRVNGTPSLTNWPGATAALAARSRDARAAHAQNLAVGIAQLKARVPGVEVVVSPITGSAEVLTAAGALTPAVPNRSGFDLVKDFLQANPGLYGLGNEDIANLRFIGESVSPGSGLRMVRAEQTVRGRPVFQSETRFIIDREGRLIRCVGLLVPNASATAPPLVNAVPAQNALVAALASVNLVVDPAGMTLANTRPDGSKTEVVANHPQISGNVPSELVYFPVAPAVLVLAWSQVTMTKGAGDWYTIVDANTGALLWRKNIRAHASTQEARFSVYVQADGKTPADSPAPLSPTTATPGSGFQPPGIARTTVNMSVVQDIMASPNGWISDGGTTTTGNNVDAYMDAQGAANANLPDTSVFFRLDGNGRPTGNPDAAARNRDFLGTTPRNFTMTPPPQAGNPESGQTATGNGNNGTTDIDAFRRGAVTHLFYVANWYHDQLYALGFDEAAGNFQEVNFSGMGAGNDRVLAEAQDSSGTDNANFSTPPDGQPGRMQMYVFTGPTVDRDGGLDAEIVIHELTHGLSNRLIGNGSGLNWDVGAGMGEGWSDFYALSLLNNTSTDDPDGKYVSGAYATYKIADPSVTNNYLYGIRRFPYSTDNSVNPLTWADVDDVTFDLTGGIPASPLDFSGAGACEVHNIGEIWCNTLWEVRSRVIADPAGANGDVPTGNKRMLQVVTDALKMTPLNPSFIDARDALIAADAAANGATNEIWIWQGFADRGLGYNAVAPFSRMFGYSAGHGSIGESFDIPYLDVQSVAIDDSLGNNNGAIDPGEPVKITVKLKNPWRRTSFGVASATATLSSTTAGVNIITGNATYPAIPALGTADGTQFQFSVPSGASAGQALQFTITPTSSLGTRAVNFTLRVGTPAGTGAPITFTRTITGGLAIPDNAPRGVVSTLTITNDLEIADLNFRLDSLTHTFTGDITVLLRAPNGLGTDLISALGGLAADGGSGNNFVNTVIDDQASGDLLTAVAASAPFSGSWKPTFNASSWDAAWGLHDPVGLLSRYNGLSTAGDWKVLVSDQVAADTGALNSWSLIVTPRAFTATPFVARVLTVASVNPASGVSITVSPDDNNGQGNGVSEFIRSYNNVLVSLTAPATAGGNDFLKWQRDGADWAATPATTVMMDADHVMTAIYATPASVVTVAAADATAAEPSDPGTFVFTRSGSTAGALMVNFALSGTATNGTDYAALDASVIFVAGSATATNTVNVIDDTAVEAAETVVITLLAGTGYTIGSQSNATVTIADDDAEVTVAATDAAAGEPGSGQGTGTFTFSRTGATSLSLTVNFTVGGTASGGSDYELIGGSVTFAPGSITTNQMVLVIDDDLVESNETVVITLGAGSGYAVGSPSSALITIHDDEPAALVVSRLIFYNHSSWDGNNPAANTNDDLAIAPNKTALLPGGTATFTNYTSYSKGINGIMVDVVGLAGTPTASDFTFKSGNNNAPAGWTNAPAPTNITVRPGAGVGGSDRVTLIWADNAIQKQWLQITVLATAITGLAAPDVFYFGNAIGESGGFPNNAHVDLADEIDARNHPRNFVNPAPIDDRYDYDRNQRVDLLDEIIARNNPANFVTALQLISPPASVLPAGTSGVTATAVAALGGGAEISPKSAGHRPILSIQRDNLAYLITVTDIGPGLPQLEVTEDLTVGPWIAVPVTPVFEPATGAWQWRISPPMIVTQQFFRTVIPLP